MSPSNSDVMRQLFNSFYETGKFLQPDIIVAISDKLPSPASQPILYGSYFSSQKQLAWYISVGIASEFRHFCRMQIVFHWPRPFSHNIQIYLKTNLGLPL